VCEIDKCITCQSYRTMKDCDTCNNYSKFIETNTCQRINCIQCGSCEALDNRIKVGLKEY
jgi:hypothetical protein